MLHTCYFHPGGDVYTKNIVRIETKPRRFLAPSGLYSAHALIDTICWKKNKKKNDSIKENVSIRENVTI